MVFRSIGGELLAVFQGGDAVGATEFVGKVVGIVEAAGVGDLGDAFATAMLEHSFCLLEADKGEKFVKSEACVALEGATKVLGADKIRLSNSGQVYVR